MKLTMIKGIRWRKKTIEKVIKERKMIAKVEYWKERGKKDETSERKRVKRKR